MIPSSWFANMNYAIVFTVLIALAPPDMMGLSMQNADAMMLILALLYAAFVDVCFAAGREA